MQHFDRCTWYSHDRRIFENLGFQVYVSRNLWDVPLWSDLYFAWWPTTGALPCAVSIALRRPFVLVGAATDLVNRYNGLESEIGYYTQPWLVRQAISRTCRAADHIVAISAHTAEQLAILGSKRVTVVPCCVDTEIYTPAPHESRDRVPYALCIITNLDRATLKRKRLVPALDALARARRACPDLRFVVIGAKGDAMDDLTQHLAALGIESAVDFVGIVSEKRKIELLQGALVYVQPTYHENFGVAIAEAMACGCPVIASPAGAVPEVVSDCGLYADADDSVTMAQHLIGLSSDAAKVQELGTRSRTRIEKNFSISARQTRMASVLSSLGFEVPNVSAFSDAA